MMALFRWALLLTLAGTSLTASADAPAVEVDAAKAAFERGTRLFQRGDFAAALVAFRRAYSLRPHHAVLCSQARCHERLNQPLEAAAHYRRCLQEGARATLLATRIQRALEAVEHRVAGLRVTGSPGLEVSVDGRPVGVAPLRVAVNPGRLVIELRRSGRVLAASKVVLTEGEQRTVELRPAPIGDPPGADRPSRRRQKPHWFWITASTTVALAVATAALGAVTLQKRSAFDAEPTRATADTFYRHRLATNILLGVTLAAAGASATLFFFTDFGSKESSRTSGVALAGTF